MYTRSLSLSFFNLFLFLVCICSNTLQVLSHPKDDEIWLNIWMTNFWKYGALYPCSLYYLSSYYFHIKNKERKKQLQFSHHFMLSFLNFLINNIHDTSNNFFLITKVFLFIYHIGNMDSTNKLLNECFSLVVHPNVPLWYVYKASIVFYCG